MTFYLLRHGAYDEGTEVLNQRGIDQISRAFEYLLPKVINPQIVSSKGPRAQLSANILSKKFKKNVITVDWLKKPNIKAPFQLVCL